MIKKTDNLISLISRPPVVVIMGHIDHGKSKLLDYIRKTNVVEKEAGGITQHIGAYEANVKCDSSHEHKTRKITFLDTPGHEAFSKMRTRGAKIADIAVLVIAADEGIKPQTLEAYEAIKNANIPFVIALNKIDKPNSDPDRIKSQLAEKQIFVENFGGNIPTANISAKTGEGVDELLDIVLLLTEMENLSANSAEQASGAIIESHLDPQRGNTATLLIQNGTIKKGVFILSGNALAPVRIFENFLGQPLEEATFSSPIKIVGFDNMPEVGAEFKAFISKKEAEEFRQKNHTDKSQMKITINKTEEGKIAIHLILKTDVTGSSEALESEILKLKNEKVIINILRKGTGNINEDDAKLASSASNSIIVGFNVETDQSAKDLAERFGVAIFTSDIIYRISEWLDEEIKKLISSQDKSSDRIIGTATIVKTFSKTKNKQVIGGKVISGKIVLNGKFKIKRNNEEIGEGKITELQHNKTSAKEVNEGNEFGAKTESKIEILKNDEVVVII